MQSFRMKCFVYNFLYKSQGELWNQTARKCAPCGFFLGPTQLPQEREESHTARWDQARLSQLMKIILRCEGFPNPLTTLKWALPSPSRWRRCPWCESWQPWLWLEGIRGYCSGGTPHQCSHLTACSAVVRLQALGSNWPGFKFCLSYFQLCFLRHHKLTTTSLPVKWNKMSTFLMFRFAQGNLNGSSNFWANFTKKYLYLGATLSTKIVNNKTKNTASLRKSQRIVPSSKTNNKLHTQRN